MALKTNSEQNESIKRFLIKSIHSYGRLVSWEYSDKES